jgi:heat shock protein HspQ
MERALFRHLRRVARSIDALVVERQPALTFSKEAKRFTQFLPPSHASDQPLSLSLRQAFDKTEVSDAAAVDNAFAALRRGNDRIERLNSKSWTPKPAAVQLGVGQIFRHKKHGFRGVVIEWFETCPAPEDWQERYGPFEHGFDQPFYRTLVDTKDRPNPFVALAAEENLIPLDDEELPVSHPLMEQVFDGFEDGMHTMSDETQRLFPED